MNERRLDPGTENHMFREVSLVRIETRKRWYVAVVRVSGLGQRTVKPGAVVYDDVRIDEIRPEWEWIELSDGREIERT